MANPSSILPRRHHRHNDDTGGSINLDHVQLSGHLGTLFRQQPSRGGVVFYKPPQSLIKGLPLHVHNTLYYHHFHFSFFHYFYFILDTLLDGGTSDSKTRRANALLLFTSLFSGSSVVGDRLVASLPHDKRLLYDQLSTFVQQQRQGGDAIGGETMPPAVTAALYTTHIPPMPAMDRLLLPEYVKMEPLPVTVGGWPRFWLLTSCSECEANASLSYTCKDWPNLLDEIFVYSRLNESSLEIETILEIRSQEALAAFQALQLMRGHQAPEQAPRFPRLLKHWFAKTGNAAIDHLRQYCVLQTLVNWIVMLNDAGRLHTIRPEEVNFRYLTGIFHMLHGWNTTHAREQAITEGVLVEVLKSLIFLDRPHVISRELLDWLSQLDDARLTKLRETLPTDVVCLLTTRLRALQGGDNAGQPAPPWVELVDFTTGELASCYMLALAVHIFTADECRRILVGIRLAAAVVVDKAAVPHIRPSHARRALYTKQLRVWTSRFPWRDLYNGATNGHSSPSLPASEEIMQHCTIGGAEEILAMLEYHQCLGDGSSKKSRSLADYTNYRQRPAFDYHVYTDDPTRPFYVDSLGKLDENTAFLLHYRLSEGSSEMVPSSLLEGVYLRQQQSIGRANNKRNRDFDTATAAEEPAHKRPKES